MPFSLRFFTLWFFLLVFFEFPYSSEAFTFSHPGRSFTLSSEHPEDPFLHLTAKKKKSGTSSSFIQNLRFHKHKDHTRLVIDVKGQLHFKKRNDSGTDQVVLELRDTRLSKKAFNVTRKKSFPKGITVARKWNKPVTITIDRSAVKKYKVLTLQKPNRLVLDLFPSSSELQKSNTAPTKVVKKATNKPKIASPKVLQKLQEKRKSIPPTKVLKPSKPNSQLLIVIDPGHGGKDPGAMGRKGTREKDIVLKVSMQLKDMITKQLGAKVLMTREKDVFIELEKRAEFANSQKADLFVSIHVNSHPKRSVKGLELYHFGEASDPRALEVAARENGTPLKDNAPAWKFILADKLTDKKIEESRDLAWIARKALVKKLRKHYKVKDHGVKTAPFFVLRMTTMPGILAEIAFVSNPNEEKLLTSKTYQKRVAEGIFKGIKAYITPLQTAAR